MGVILRAHPVHGESRIQRNANREVATICSSSTIVIFAVCGCRQGYSREMQLQCGHRKETAGVVLAPSRTFLSATSQIDISSCHRCDLE